MSKFSHFAFVNFYLLVLSFYAIDLLALVSEFSPTLHIGGFIANVCGGILWVQTLTVITWTHGAPLLSTESNYLIRTRRNDGQSTTSFH